MKVYKTKEEGKPGVVVLYIDSKPTDKQHESILRLSMFSDIFFVFSKSILKLISPKKFSILYQSVFYGKCLGEDKTLEIWKSIDYLNEFSKYFSYTVIKDLEILEKDDLAGLEKLQNSVIENSVFSWRNLGNEEFQEIYTLKKKWFWKYEDDLGLYSRKTSEDNLFFLRPISVTKLKEEFPPEVIATFKGSGINTLLPSLINPETNINMICKNIINKPDITQTSQK